MKKINKEKLKKVGLFIVFIVVSFSIFTTVKLMYHLYGPRFEFSEESITSFEEDLNKLKVDSIKIREKYKIDSGATFITAINDLCDSGEIFLNFMKENPKTSYTKLNKNLIILFAIDFGNRRVDKIIDGFIELVNENKPDANMMVAWKVKEITDNYKFFLEVYTSDSFNYQNKKTSVYLYNYFEGYLDLMEILLKEE